jgi:hypothetical protein
MKPSSRTLFMKWRTRDRVIPIISASISWDFCYDGLWPPFLAKLANSKHQREPLSVKLKS